MAVVRKVVMGTVALTDAGLAMPRWLRQARCLTAQFGVTGGLIFDGERWMQLLEGDEPAVDRMHHTMTADPALGELQPLLFEVANPPTRLCARWLIGYVEPEDVSQLLEQCAIDGKASLQALVRVLSDADSG